MNCRSLGRKSKGYSPFLGFGYLGLGLGKKAVLLLVHLKHLKEESDFQGRGEERRDIYEVEKWCRWAVWDPGHCL